MRDSTIRKTPSATPLRAGKAAIPRLRPIGTGSHIDAIPNAGLYDGCVGVLGGLEAIRVLQETRLQAAPIDRIGHFHRRGAYALRHRMPGQPHDGQRAHSRTGACAARQGRPRAGGVAPQLDSPARSNRSRCPKGRFHQFVELHIEQGPLLEQEGLDVGLVTHIAAPASHAHS
jgi:ureidoglycolate amidohydrolase